MQTATVKWVDQQQFLANMPSGHAIPIDADRARNSAPGPMELLLAALGSCTATDVVTILAKKRQKLERLEVVVTGEKAAEPPAVWTRLEVVYRLFGALDEQAVRHTIELSETKYCSVAAMLRQTAPISYRYEILPATST
ncbi:MAG TPA: OsmC family protein [Candidatus Acidoferrales bacterium]|nr:OsmC family protein [Candidatus Acidoferrales bacterium]